jgi:hypothetical protein
MGKSPLTGTKTFAKNAPVRMGRLLRTLGRRFVSKASKMIHAAQQTALNPGAGLELDV